MWQKKTSAPGFREFLRDIKNDSIKNVVFLYGEEQYLIKWGVESLCKKYILPEAKPLDYMVLDGNKSTPMEILNNCNTLPFISEKKIVWVNNFKPLKSYSNMMGYGEEGIKQIIQYFEFPAEHTILIISNDEIDGRGKLVKSLKKEYGGYLFDKINDKELRSFALKRFKNAGLSISNKEMNFLIELTGYNQKESNYDLYSFDNDIKKIIAHSKDSITYIDITNNIHGNEDTFVFDLIDSLGKNDKALSLEILHNKMKEEPYGGLAIIGAIISQFELMLEISEILEKNNGTVTSMEISRQIGVHNFRVQKAMNFTKKHSLKDMRRLLNNSYEAYKNIVSGILTPQLAIELFISQI